MSLYRIKMAPHAVQTAGKMTLERLVPAYEAAERGLSRSEEIWEVVVKDVHIDLDQAVNLSKALDAPMEWR